MKKLILIIEDNLIDAMVLRNILEEENYIIHHFIDGRDLLPTLNANIYDAVFIDWDLPFLSGIELIKLIRSNSKWNLLPIIVMTRMKEEYILTEAFDGGANDFITKPVCLKEVIARVNNLTALFKSKETILDKNIQLEELNALILENNKMLKESIRLTDRLSKDKEMKLEADLAHLSKKMISDVLRSTSIDQKMIQISKHIEKLKSNLEETEFKRIDEVLKLIEELRGTQFLWEEFPDLFDHLLDGFFSHIKKINPEIAATDLRICAFIRMELDYLEIAKILSMDPNSFKMKRYRLKKKLNIPQNTSLRAFLSKL